VHIQKFHIIGACLGLTLAIGLALYLSGVYRELVLIWNSSPAIVTVDVDLSKPGPAALATGFLHGPAPSLDSKAGRLVQALHPKLWRASWPVETLDRARQYGARPMLLISDYWRYPRNGNWRKPYAQTSEWRDFNKLAAQKIRGNHWILDIWNEPNLKGFFDGTQQQAIDTFIAADRILHTQLGPDIEIAGPSLSHFDLEWMTRFAQTCIRAGVKVEVLAWHEFVPAAQSQMITQHLNQARQRFIDNPRFVALGVKKLMVTETLRSSEWLRPASILAYREALEAGGADATARACWKWATGKSGCFDGSMDGLLTDRDEPRAAWWAERVLVPMGDRRVKASASPHWHVIANKSSLILGTLNSGRTNLRIRIKGIEKAAGVLRICGWVIPDSGVLPVPQLFLSSCRYIRIENHSTIMSWPAPPSGAVLWFHFSVL
jgi:hypothetical protein